MDAHPRLVVILPCLNEADTVADVIDAIPRHIDGVSEVAVVVVDDGSVDATAARAKAAGARVISHGVNRGVGAALQTGIEHALEEGFDLVCHLDADAQFDAADITKLVAPLVRHEADFVSASRFVDDAAAPRHMPWVRRWGNRRIAALVSRLAGQRFSDVSCGFRAYSREALLHLNLQARFTYTQETFLILSDKRLRIVEVPVQVRYFEGRRSRVAPNVVVYGVRAASIILRLYRDYHPLRFFWSLAALSLGMGALFGTNLLVHYLASGRFSGQIWSGFVGAAFAGLGFALLVVGVLADMLDRVRVNQERMLYLLKKNEYRPSRARSPSADPVRSGATPAEVTELPRSSRGVRRASSGSPR